MQHSNREVISIVNKVRTLSQDEIDRAYADNIYPQKSHWKIFIKWLLFAIGAGFTLAGVVFFFAYNWQYMHRFLKLGLVELLFITSVGSALTLKVSPLLRNVMITTSSFLVGIMFLVYGQIYQTGANAYDLFLIWTLSVALWTAVTPFAPQWLLFLALAQTTMYLYCSQNLFGFHWSMTLLSGVDLILLVVFMLMSAFRKEVIVPQWFLNVIVLGAATFVTTGLATGVHDRNSHDAVSVLGVMTLLAYPALFYLDYRRRNLFSIGLLPFSVLLIFISMMFTNVDGIEIFFGTGLVLLAGVTGIVVMMLNLQKKWKREKVEP